MSDIGDEYEPQEIIEDEYEPRGFAAMPQERRRETAARGGTAAHAAGKAHKFTSEEARIAGKKGGASTSRDREFMSKIGKKGGDAVSQDRERMAEIGCKGGQARAKKASRKEPGPRE